MLGVEAPPPAPPDDAIASANNVAGPSSDGAGEIKLVFLDIDGVICCNGIGRLEPDKLARIGEVCKRTDAKVVLSTDWRRDAGLKAMCTDALHQHGCTVIGATRKGPPLQPIRPKEIWGWLQSYQNEKNKRVSQWVAIDDRALLMEQGGENLKGHFVGTNFATGLTDRCMERCVQVLNGNHEEGMGMQSKLNTLPRSGSPAKPKRASSPARPGPRGAAASDDAAGGGGASGKGFGAATAGKSSASTVPAGAKPGWGTAGTGARAASPARTPKSAGGGAGAATPGDPAARNAAFGRAKPGLHSPTYARKSGAPAAAEQPAGRTTPRPPPPGAAAAAPASGAEGDVAAGGDAA